MEARALSGASIVGQPGGWSVLLKFGMEERPLGIRRADRPRLWWSLDTCVDYLNEELHIGRIDLLESAQCSATTPLPGKSRPDAAEQMRKAFADAEHDAWFRELVEIGMRERRMIRRPSGPQTRRSSSSFSNSERIFIKERNRWEICLFRLFGRERRVPTF